MNKLGVVSSELKALAKPVLIPELICPDDIDGEIREVLGMKVKNITTLGERSAVGLSDESGVWIIEVSNESPVVGILMPNDVILQINKAKIKNINEMRQTLEKAGKKMIITISRNQKEQEVELEIK